MNAYSTIVTMLAGAAPPLKPGSYFGMPDQASTIASSVDWIYDVITWICVFFFVLIAVVMGWFMVKYRRRSHVANTGGLTHHMALEVTWTVIPLILVIAIFYVGFEGYLHIITPPENAYPIKAVGQRWFWTFNYNNGATDTNILHVPVGRPVRLDMRSDDVIHAMFIPDFRVKQDVVPGRRTELWFEVIQPGEYQLYCSEYCGTQHSQMAGKVMAYEPDEFEVVIRELAVWCEKVPQDMRHLGGALIYNQCSVCHTLDGTRLIGPSFLETHQLFKDGGTRRGDDGTEVKVDEDYLRNSILRPLDHIAVNHQTNAAYNTSMPVQIGNQLGPCKVELMVQFIMRLDEVAPGGRRIEVNRQDLTAPGAAEGN